MQQYGTENLSAYLRKMALDGYVVKLELPELKELVSLMRRSSNNLNQLTRKAVSYTHLKAVETVDTASEALAVSIAERACVDKMCIRDRIWTG